MSKYLTLVKDGLHLIGGKSLFFLLLAVLGSLFLTVIELGVAAILNLFLASFELVDVDLVPEILRPYAVQKPETICFMLMGVGFIRFLGQGVSQYGAVAFRQDVSLNFRKNILKRILFVDGSLGLSKGEIYTTLTEILPHATTFIFNFLQIIMTVIYTSTLLVTLFYLAWKQTLIGLAGLFIVGIFSLLVQQRYHFVAKSLPQLSEAFNRGIDQITTNWNFIRICRTEESEFQRLNKHNTDFHSSFNRMKIIEIVSGNLPHFLGIVIVATILLSSHQTGFEVNMISFLYLFLRFSQKFGSTTQIISSSAQTFPYFEIACRRNRDYRESKLIRNQSVASSERFPKPPTIDIKNISFGWDGPDSDSIFADFSLKVGEGNAIGIMGKSGVGKSTLLNIVLGRLRPNKGEVEINSQSVDNFLERYSSSLAYVGASHFLFDGTLRENLRYGMDGSVSEDEYHAALRKAHIYEKVMTLPGTIDFVFKNSEDVFSSGEKQRLALARAILRKPKVLILDEASANLDQETEVSIAETLEGIVKGCTTLAVSHSKVFLKFCDKIVKI